MITHTTPHPHPLVDKRCQAFKAFKGLKWDLLGEGFSPPTTRQKLGVRSLTPSRSEATSKKFQIFWSEVKIPPPLEVNDLIPRNLRFSENFAAPTTTPLPLST